jgi:hypothetical protein
MSAVDQPMSMMPLSAVMGARVRPMFDREDVAIAERRIIAEREIEEVLSWRRGSDEIIGNLVRKH